MRSINVSIGAASLAFAMAGCAAGEALDSAVDEVTPNEHALSATDGAEADALMARCPGVAGSERVELLAYLPAAPSELFPYLSYADRIDWLGPFHIAKFGVPHPYGAGSKRVVGLDSAPIVEETIFHYDSPRTLVYGVTKSGTYKNHCAVMRVTPAGRGSRLAWSIRFDAHGVTGDFLRWYTESYLRGRLDILKSRLR